MQWHVETQLRFREPGGRAWRRLGSLAALLLVLSACAPAPAASPAQPTQAPAQPTVASAQLEPVSLKVVVLPYMSFAPVYLAAEDGDFDAQNLRVELVDMTGQQETLPAILSGQVDVTSGNLSSGTFNTVARGGQLKIAADKGHIASADGCADFALLARHTLLPSGGGVALTADVLQGRKISVIPGSWQAYYTDRALAQVGSKIEDLETVGLQAPATLDAMANSQIDLASIAEPWVTRLSTNGSQPVLTPVQQLMPGAQYSTLIFGAKLLGQNADVGNRFMLAFLKAVRTYNTEGKSERIMQIVSRYTQLDRATLEAICWPTFRDDGALDVPSMLDFQNWAMAHGQIETAVSPEQFSDPSFLAFANARLGVGAR